MGQLNRPFEPTAHPAPATNPANGNESQPQSPAHPQLSEPASLSGLARPQPPARTTRPPLEPPQMGQLNRPLSPSDTPSGLPSRGAVPDPAAGAGPDDAPDAPDAPSGLPARPQPPAGAGPAGEQARGHHNG
ncbi:hypothetical protein ACWEOZ_39300 [Actinoplanes sp. NPDC004185]